MDISDISQLKEEFLTCPLCDEDVFQNGRDFHILPMCQHSLCEKCVEGIAERRKGRDPLLCPWCRQEFVLPDSGKLPTFRYASTLYDKLKVYETSRKRKPRVRRQPTQVSVVKEKKPKPDRLVLLGKFKLGNLSYKTVCAGRNGVFYGRLCGEGGLASINWLAGGKVQRFGDLLSLYSDMRFDGDELFACNCSQSCIEVYRDHKMVRSWTIYGFGKSFIKLGLCPRERQVLTIAHDCWSRMRINHFSKLGEQVSTQGIKEQWKHLISINSDIFNAHGSLWVIDSNDEHLWEIPAQELSDGIVYMEPVKHCKVGSHMNACQWGEDKILYTNGALVKAIDLAAIKSSDAPSGGRRRTQSEIKPTINHLFSGEYEEGDGLFLSDDGFMLILADDAGSLFKLVQSEQLLSDVTISMATENIPGPEYSNIFEQFNRKRQYCEDVLRNYISNFLCNIFLFIMLLHFACWYRPDLNIQVDQFLRGVCQFGLNYFGRTYGWSNLYISLCEQQLSTSSRSCYEGNG